MDKLAYYTIPELKRYARENNIQLAGLTRKTDILNEIKNRRSTE